MTKITHVVIVSKLSCKGKCVIISCEPIHFFFEVVLIIVDVFA